MLVVDHPSTFLDNETTEEIRAKAYQAEMDGKLHPVQLALVRKNNWFNLYVPKQLGGLELSIPEILKILEGLAWADGSTAWVTTLCSGAAWFAGFLDPELAHKIFSDPHTIIAGSGSVTGKAQSTKDGYKITGYWKYASGSPWATAFSANCILYDGESMLFNEDGSSRIGSFIFFKDEVQMHENWNMMGMTATASHSFEVKDLLVPFNRLFFIDPSQSKSQNRIFQFPFLQLAEITLTVNLSGMAMRFMDLCHKLLSEKEDGEKELSNQERENQTLSNHRQEFYDSIEKAWLECLAGKVPASSCINLSTKSHELAYQSRIITERFYPLCGMVAASKDQEINRVWRNLHTASQHSLFHKG